MAGTNSTETTNTSTTNTETTESNNQAGAPAKSATTKTKMHTIRLERKPAEVKEGQIVANITHRAFQVNGVLVDVPIGTEGGIEVDDATYTALQAEQLPEGYSLKKQAAAK